MKVQLYIYAIYFVLGVCTSVSAQELKQKLTTVNISSIAELRETLSKSHQRVIMKPGVYDVSDLADQSAVFRFSGSHNYFDLTGVSILRPISSLKPMRLQGRIDRSSYAITGDHVTLKGCTFENVYPDGRIEVTDFGSYNQDAKNAPPCSMTEITIQGDDVAIIGCKVIVRGSYPYGYGNIYGIGAGAVVALRKHSGILITGDRVMIDGCRVKMESFGHAIFVQGGDQVTVKDTVVEGEVRRSNELYEENNKGDLPSRFDYKVQWPETVKGLPIPRDHMINLTEDGIRAYPGTGHMTVENCKVSKCRGGIKLYLARSAEVSNCEVIDCVNQGYSVPSRGTIVNCRGNVAYGSLLYIHFDSHSSQDIDLEVVASPHGLGDHPLAALKGKGHRVRFVSSESSPPKQIRPIIVGYPLRFDFLSVDYPELPEGCEELFDEFAPKTYKASRITLSNATDNPVVLAELSEGNKVTSRGPVLDLGKQNLVISE